MERLREGDLDVLSRQKWGERFMITIPVPSGGRVRSMPVTSPTSSAFPIVSDGSDSRILPPRDFMRKGFRDRRYSLRSGLLVCSPARSPLPLRLDGRRTAVTFPSEQITRPYR